MRSVRVSLGPLLCIRDLILLMGKRKGRKTGRIFTIWGTGRWEDGDLGELGSMNTKPRATVGEGGGCSQFVVWIVDS